MRSVSVKQRAAAVYKGLRKKFGAKPAYAKKDPVDQVIFCILLSKGPPQAAERAFAAFKADYVDWNEVRVTSVPEIAFLLKPAGVSVKAAPFIRESLQKLYLYSHSVCGESLRKMSPKRAKEFLESSAGLGEEQIIEILMESLGMPIIPVNDAMRQAFIRLGISEKGASILEAQKGFEAVAANGKPCTAYRLLRVLTKDFCREEELACRKCPVKKHCPTGRERIRLENESRGKKPPRADETKPPKKKAPARAKK